VLTKSAKDPALRALADLLRCADDTLLMVMEGKVKIVCTGSEGCVPYEAPSSKFNISVEAITAIICIKASV
jgi:hypothetical protein